jgi:hypothetical protein
LNLTEDQDPVSIKYHHVVRTDNQAVDELSKLGSTRAKVLARVFVQDLVTPSIKQGQEVVEEAPHAEQLVAVVPGPSSDWREPFIKYLTTAHVLADKTEMERLIHRSKHYILVDGKLMRRNAKEELLQKCVSKEEGEKILKEIHPGTCGNHATSRTLVGKAFRAGFSWPSAVADVEALVHRCEGCQFFAN